MNIKSCECREVGLIIVVLCLLLLATGAEASNSGTNRNSGGNGRNNPRPTQNSVESSRGVLPFDPCLMSPCLHSGQCRPHSSQHAPYTCLCKLGFSGDHCESIQQECEVGLCMNGADCISTPGGFVCDCPPGVAGRYCETQVERPRAVRYRWSLYRVSVLVGSVCAACVLTFLVATFSSLVATERTRLKMGYYSAGEMASPDGPPLPSLNLCALSVRVLKRLWFGPSWATRQTPNITDDAGVLQKSPDQFADERSIAQRQASRMIPDEEGTKYVSVERLSLPLEAPALRHFSRPKQRKRRPTARNRRNVPHLSTPLPACPDSFVHLTSPPPHALSSIASLPPPPGPLSTSSSPLPAALSMTPVRPAASPGAPFSSLRRLSPGHSASPVLLHGHFTPQHLKVPSFEHARSISSLDQ